MTGWLLGVCAANFAQDVSVAMYVGLGGMVVVKAGEE